LKQSETKDQTGKGTKIKGSNYNLSEGLDYKIVRTSKDQIRNIHFDRKTTPFQSTISSPFFTVVSADSGAISAKKKKKKQIASIMGNVSRLLFLYMPLPSQTLHRRAFFGL
jgi:uroporphyrinogen-III decarboxylase